MKKLMSLVLLAGVAAGVSPSYAQVVRQVGGAMPVQQFVQCSVAPTWAFNPRGGGRLSRGGWGFTGLGADGNTVTRAYTNDVWIGKRRMIAPSYTYLDPVDPSGQQCNFAGQ